MAATTIDSLADPLKADDGPEIVIGLVAPLGTNLDLLVGAISRELRRVNYKSELIHLSSLFTRIERFEDLPERPLEERYLSRMKAGTEIREMTKRGDALALMSVVAIRERRDAIKGFERTARRTAFILRSLKHPDEISSLRAIYGKAFFVISAYSDRDKRVESLSDSIAKSHAEPLSKKKFRDKAENLIHKDEIEESTKLGQDVTDAFPMGDFFLNITTRDAVEKDTRRFVEILFGHPFRTPTKNEIGMFEAHAFSLRSADLSRQVGAVVTTKSGHLLTAGCNEVPKAGGGQYWQDDQNDYRDFKIGYDSSAKQKEEILKEVFSRLQRSSWLIDEHRLTDLSELVESLLQGKNKEILKGAQILSLLEFGRVVHAEMAAITAAAERGIPLKDGVLYSTTFPCHMCARHIIAAGIDTVVYIYPYPKSMASDLYKDSIALEVRKNQEPQVLFTPFVGVSPRRFLDLFEMPRRKYENGDIFDWEPSKAQPRLKRYVPSYMMIEAQVTDFIYNKLESVGLKLRN